MEGADEENLEKLGLKPYRTYGPSSPPPAMAPPTACYAARGKILCLYTYIIYVKIIYMQKRIFYTHLLKLYTEKVKMQKKNIVYILIYICIYILIYSLNSGFGNGSFLNPMMVTQTPRNQHWPIALRGGSNIRTPSATRQQLFQVESSV